MNEKIRQLLAELKKKTELGQANWFKTSRDNEFILKMKKGSVSINDGADWTQHVDLIDIIIRNENAAVAYRTSYTKRDNPTEYAELQTLHKAARSSIYGLNETLESMLEEAEGEGIIGAIEPDWLSRIAELDADVPDFAKAPNKTDLKDEQPDSENEIEGFRF